MDKGCVRCGFTDYRYENLVVTSGVVWEETAYCLNCDHFVYHRYRDKVEYAPKPNLLKRVFYRFIYGRK